MKNTIENKQRFFANYFGQNVMNYMSHLHTIEPMLWHWINDSHLELKPLSEISDEDLNILVSIFRGKPLKNCIIERTDDKTFITVEYNREGKLDEYSDYDYITMSLWIRTEEGTISNRWGYVRGNSTGITYNQTDNILQCYDYLRSRGYLLPFMDLTIEQILEYGWAVLKSK